MDKFLYLISEGLKNVWRHKMTTFTAVFSLFLALYFVGLLATAGENTRSILQYLRSKYKIEVFFKQNVDLKSAKKVSDLILEVKGVRSSTVINKDDAVRIFKDQFGEDILGVLGYNPLPISAVVNLKRNSEEMLKIAPVVSEIKKMKGVQEVRYQGHLIKKIERTYSRFMQLFPGVAVLFITVSVLVIYNTVKLSIFSRKELIDSLKLIGATKLFIQMPFIFEGLIDGVLATLISIPLIMGTVGGTNYMIDNFTSWNIELTVAPILFIWLTLLSGIISVLGSYRAVSGIMK
ncbi:ABC transporter permease [bacterium]|jgi:cell division transport system permease protein|nr:ABC transporter permease [bacterium]MBT4248757.1 ABC transporter permease [bacterium]MBT5733685.1 ABC transporter permease [bacterium]MBT6018296.1 ABC transporter permease [bacterium]MBT6776698.1 ABC transporter permease [bacterium]